MRKQTRSSTILNKQGEVVGFETADSFGGNAKGYNEVTASAATLIDSLRNGTPIELVPAQGVDKYIVIDKLIVEYKSGATAFNCDWRQKGFIPNAGTLFDVTTGLIGGGLTNHLGDAITILRPASVLTGIPNYSTATRWVGKNVYFAFDGDGTTTGGTGTARFKIWFSIHTFNTNAVVG